MYQHKTIQIIKTDENKRQVQFAWLAFDEFDSLDKAKEFALNYKHWQTIEIRDGDALVEELHK